MVVQEFVHGAIGVACLGEVGREGVPPIGPSWVRHACRLAGRPL